MYTVHDKEKGQQRSLKLYLQSKMQD